MVSSTRRVLFAATIAAALALPVLTYLALQAGHRYQALQLRLAGLNRERAELGDYRRHVQRFHEHVALLSGFSKAARRFGISPGNWDTHEVNIKQMFVSYSDFKGFLADMGSSGDAYFIPGNLDIKTRPTVTYGDVKASGHGDVSEGGVTVSLTGQFMVEH